MFLPPAFYRASRDLPHLAVRLRSGDEVLPHAAPDHRDQHALVLRGWDRPLRARSELQGAHLRSPPMIGKLRKIRIVKLMMFLHLSMKCEECT